MRAKQKPPRYLKILVIIGSVLMVISGGTLALVYGLSSRYQADQDNILDGVPQGAGNIGEGPLNLLVLGTDSREDEQTEQIDSTGSNSDTIILVHVAKGLNARSWCQFRATVTSTFQRAEAGAGAKKRSIRRLATAARIWPPRLSTS